MILVLVLIYYIILFGNVFFEKFVVFFVKFLKYLIIEFLKCEDFWVELLLVRKCEFINYFDFYNFEEFEKGYLIYFEFEKKEEIKGINRVFF